jgi:hypothetical protein
MPNDVLVAPHVLAKAVNQNNVATRGLSAGFWVVLRCKCCAAWRVDRAGSIHGRIVR